MKSKNITEKKQSLLIAFINKNHHFNKLKLTNYVTPSQSINLETPSGLTVGDYFK